MRNNEHNAEEIFTYLLETKQLIPSNERGIFSYRGLFLSLMKALDETFVEKAKANYRIIEENYPTFIPVSELNKINFYSKFPAFTTIMYPIDRENVENVNKIAQDSKDKKINNKYFKENAKLLSDCSCHAMNPSTCYHTFIVRKNSVMTNDLQVITAVSQCYRNEIKDDNNPLRLAMFQMRECVFIGNENEVMQAADEFFNIFKEEIACLAEDYEENYASDLFFGENSDVVKNYQISKKVKLEMNLPIPMANSPKENQQLACMSRNYHRNSLCNAFSLESENNNLHSACVAIGLERLTYALLCQIGFNVDFWKDCKIKRSVLKSLERGDFTSERKEND